MSVAQHYLAKIVNGSPPPRHIAVKNYDPNARKELSIEAIIEACEKRGVDPHDVIAQALTDEMREQAQDSGMNMKAQADLVARLLPARKELTGKDGGPLEVKSVQRTIVEPD